MAVAKSDTENVEWNGTEQNRMEQNRIEYPEISHMIFKGAKNIHWRKDSLSTNGIGKTGYSQRRLKLYLYLLPCAKSIQNGLRTLI
jgi:hypothetical protein